MLERAHRAFSRARLLEDQSSAPEEIWLEGLSGSLAELELLLDETEPLRSRGRSSLLAWNELLRVQATTFKGWFTLIRHGNGASTRHTTLTGHMMGQSKLFRAKTWACVPDSRQKFLLRRVVRFESPAVSA